MVAARAQHVEPALPVHDQGVEGVAVARDLPRRQVDEGVRAFRDPGEVVRLEDAAAVEVEPRVALEAGQVLDAPVREVVEPEDLVPPRDQPLGEVRADESGDAGDGDLQADLLQGTPGTRKRARLYPQAPAARAKVWVSGRRCTGRGFLLQSVGPGCRAPGFVSGRPMTATTGGREVDSGETAISNKVFVGNLSFDVTRDELIRAFSAADKVGEAKVETDRDAGRQQLLHHQMRA